MLSYFGDFAKNARPSKEALIIAPTPPGACGAHRGRGIPQAHGIPERILSLHVELALKSDGEPIREVDVRSIRASPCHPLKLPCPVVDIPEAACLRARPREPIAITVLVEGVAISSSADEASL